MRHILIVLLAVLATGCDGFGPIAEKKARFVGSNVSSDPIEFTVDNGPGYPVLPNKSAEYTIPIPVPKNRVNPGQFITTGPSLNDKDVTVWVQFKNLRTGLNTPSIPCTAGAKITTIVEFIFDRRFGDRGITRCEGRPHY